jgi:D-lactate dehydrogenase (cytochrome)
MFLSQNQAATSRAIELIRQKLGDRLSVALAHRESHGKDQTSNAGYPPDAVAFVESTEEVSDLMAICAQHLVPVIPYGAGTSLEGHFAAPFGGISIDLSGMNKVLEVNAEDMDCRVEAGVTRKQLNVELRSTGLFFPVDPGADASIGGMAATRASGTNAVRYGTMKDNVIGLTVVMADGKVIRTGGRARKSAAGYDLTRLMVGSEGTLGVITEIALKLHGIPESVVAGVIPFPSIAACCQATISTIQMGIPVARIELVDEEHIKAFNSYAGLALTVAPTLFVEFHGTEAATDEQVQRFTDIASGEGARDFAWATAEEERTKLWQARHDAFWATKNLMGPDYDTFSTDVAVPISRLAECVVATQADLASNGIYGPLVGHVGDGNFHLGLYTKRGDKVQNDAVHAFYDRMIERALAMGGTCTGEHGIGMGKRHYLQREHGEAVGVMQAIKRALDPDNILNPGKNAGHSHKFDKMT